MSAHALSNYIRMTTGCLLTVFGLWGVLYAGNAARGQWIYFQTRYGEQAVPPDEILRRTETADSRYPHNYYMARLCASEALEAATHAENEADCLRYLDAADYWSRRALRLNPYRSEIQQLRCQVLEGEGRSSEAAEQWRAFVEREFWNPDHHAYLARLYLQAGRIEEAEASLEWARRSRESRALKRRLGELRAPEPSRR